MCNRGRYEAEIPDYRSGVNTLLEYNAKTATVGVLALGEEHSRGHQKCCEQGERNPAHEGPSNSERQSERDSHFDHGYRVRNDGNRGFRDELLLQKRTCKIVPVYHFD